MGQESTIYGVIMGKQWHLDDSSRLQRHNQQIIATLPADDRWPFLTRPMVSCAGATVQTGTYRSQPISIGATFKSVEWEWDEWLAKFDALLARLFWDTVYLHLRAESTVGDYQYRYDAVYDDQFFANNNPRPSENWLFSGGPRAFSVDGPGDDDDRPWRFANGVWQQV